LEIEVDRYVLVADFKVADGELSNEFLDGIVISAQEKF
jgi:hypothetical protein